MTTRAMALRAGLCALFLALSPQPGAAQPVALEEPAEAANATPTEKIGFSRGSFILAPVPFRNPVLGSGVAVGGAYLFKDTLGADTSTLGLAYFRTEEGSEGYGLGVDLNFGLTGWQSTLLLGDLSLNYDLFVNGTPLPVRQTGTGAKLKFARSLSDTVSLGAGLSYLRSDLAAGNGAILPPRLQPDARLELAKISFSTDWDTRDNTDYPTAGRLARAELSYGHLLNARGRDYWKGVGSLSGYHPVFDRGVLAWTVTGCSATEDAPFFDACSLGGTDAFRGYGATEFIDSALMSGQIEYRGRLVGRLGYVAFAGLGGSGSRLGSVFDAGLRGAAGLGARIRLSNSFPVDYAIDLSRNSDGDGLLYVYVGQRF
ncbi:BamA/TamA family outer membrane protein [Dinoroseobacter sp. S124A]|uniref:BamA/TamA family outer membrane protein n=1 Tax=Dinoroseobacter sp. S124A TaxID=3415128 RepID=UPI003C7CE304